MTSAKTILIDLTDYELQSLILSIQYFSDIIKNEIKKCDDFIGSDIEFHNVLGALNGLKTKLINGFYNDTISRV